MNSKRERLIIQNIRKAKKFEEFCDFMNEAEITDTEAIEALNHLMGVTWTHHTPTPSNEHEKLRRDFAIYLDGSWRQHRTKLAILSVYTDNIKWKPFVFTDKDSALKFYNKHKLAQDREYLVIEDLEKQCEELGYSKEFANKDWSDKYDLTERKLV